MSLVLLFAIAIGFVSFWGAAYLLKVWHEDRDTGTTGWPFSRVLAYLAIAGALASNLLGAVSLLRLVDFPNFREIQLALTPLTISALVILLLLFPTLAIYLRAVRATGYMTSQARTLLAQETSVQEVIALTKEGIGHAEAAYHEANTVNQKIATLTELVASKEDKA